MSKITKDDVLYVAALSKIAISDSEAQQFTGELSVILDYVEQLDKVDTSGLEPTYQLTGLSNVTRLDEAANYHASQADLLKNAPATKDNQLEVPRVL